jgi:multiple antibiotic resistance protein
MTTFIRAIIAKARPHYAGYVHSSLSINPEKPRWQHRSWPVRLYLAMAMAVALIPVQSFAQPSATTSMPEIEFGARKMFFMLFLMLGPIKILVPFVTMTSNWGNRSQCRLASRAIFFSGAALAIAGFLGRTMLENFEISIPVLAMTGGIIWLRGLTSNDSCDCSRAKYQNWPRERSIDALVESGSVMPCRSPRSPR